MHLKFTNVNDAFRGLVESIHLKAIPTIRTTSRVGDVLQIVEPVMVTYNKPLERVLFNEERDANPFFHLYESLWMLAGRNDVAPLAYYSSKIANIASDDGETFNGAYGRRWRKSKEYECRLMTTDGFYGRPDGSNLTFKRNMIDQLAIIIDHLKRVPNSRRVVLQMWNVEDDLLKIEAAKDVCCNTAAYFLIRTETKQVQAYNTYLPREKPICDRCNGQKGTSDLDGPCARCGGTGLESQSNEVKYLDMTVTNRSNDLILGMLGANVVHFSFLQEYLAACIGVEVGTYTQMTNNLHAYVEANGGWKPEKWLSADEGPNESVYKAKSIRNFVPLVRDPVMFDREVKEFVEAHSKAAEKLTVWAEPFFNRVAEPMIQAFHFHKQRDYSDARYWIDRITSDDWRLAAKNWICKRAANYRNKQGEANGTE